MNEQLNNFLKEKAKEQKKRMDMALFREELNNLISRKNRGEIQKTMFDLTLIDDISSLTEEDAYMWYRINDYESNPISRDEFSSYQKSIKDSKNPSRFQFLSFLTQKITSIWLNKEYYDKKRK